MLKLKESNTFEAKVRVVQPVGNKMVAGTMTVIFNHIDKNKSDEYLLENENVDEYLEAIVEDVKDVEVPDGMDAKEMVLRNVPCRNAILAKYSEKMEGIERKNSKRSRYR